MRNLRYEKRQGKIIPAFLTGVLCSFMATEILADALYGVNDRGLNNSQFFCIDVNGFHWLKPSFPGYDIEGLDYVDETFGLIASAGDDVTAPAPADAGMIYLVKLLDNSDKEVPFIVNGNCNLGVPDAGVKVALSPQGQPDIGQGQFIAEVDGISARVPTDVWGWGQDVGLFRFTGAPNPPISIPAEVVVSMRGEIEDITWVGTKCYGVENMHGPYQHPFPYTQPLNNPPFRPDPRQNESNVSVNVATDTWNARIWEYDYETKNIQQICTDALAGENVVEIEALETLPDGNLLLGFHEPIPLLILVARCVSWPKREKPRKSRVSVPTSPPSDGMTKETKQKFVPFGIWERREKLDVRVSS